MLRRIINHNNENNSQSYIGENILVQSNEIENDNIQVNYNNLCHNQKNKKLIEIFDYKIQQLEKLMEEDKTSKRIFS